ncbi:hypothetical protein [Mycobacterium ostraviense]|uniref:hypothetical protein n=1 Tax=Mycobacterium ostraviense TaxID=2738409 RepID=UPI000B31C5EB|nr:hypothetical protein [Mycobacterium ostraviense]UGT91605.1 hypothetical protein LTS72_26340 [Mycobacterium ostraviense]
MSVLHTGRVRANDNSQLVVEGGHPAEEFVMLKDEHGGIHLIPAHLYEEIREETRQLTLAVDKRREYLRAVRAKMAHKADEGDLSVLAADVRAFDGPRQRVNKRFH